MYRKLFFVSTIIFGGVIFSQCSKDDTTQTVNTAVLQATFGSNIDLKNLPNYANQTIPTYITKDNSVGNKITDAKATLGRVLFYDKNLSIDNTVACASCHRQEVAFGDTDIASKGVSGGLTGRHSMRLINARFRREVKFFWDERAVSLEQQSTQPIKDHAEMGFSGQNGRPSITDLLAKLQKIGYYNELFRFVYGDVNVTEARLQESLSQFVRSIQSFDSKYDIGRAAVANDAQNFPNFSALENAGKALFLAPPQFDVNGSRIGGGLGCGGCHQAPEFDIDPNTGNNGVVGKIGVQGLDLTNTVSPTLRDVANVDGRANSPMMHNGAFPALINVLGHYNDKVADNPLLDRRLKPNNRVQRLNMTTQETEAVIAFLRTLAGKNVYTASQWSNPFLK
jgi:cytochrome c peroxidase